MYIVHTYFLLSLLMTKEWRCYIKKDQHLTMLVLSAEADPPFFCLNQIGPTVGFGPHSEFQLNASISALTSARFAVALAKRASIA